MPAGTQCRGDGRRERSNISTGNSPKLSGTSSGSELGSTEERGNRWGRRLRRKHCVHGFGRRRERRCKAPGYVSKELECEVVISNEVYQTAGLPHDGVQLKEITVRGRAAPIVVRTVLKAENLATLFERAKASSVAAA